MGIFWLCPRMACYDVRIYEPLDDPIFTCLLIDAALLITATSASVSALEPLSSPSASFLARFEAMLAT